MLIIISYNFFPVTYNLPAEYSIFFEEFKRNQSNPNNYWIMKPVSNNYFMLLNFKKFKNLKNKKI